MCIRDSYEAGGAGLVTTVDDWLKFCRMLLNKGTLDGVRILTCLLYTSRCV